jgi:inorganic pyrophosphatase
MSLATVTAGPALPDEINVVVEIPLNAEPVKYKVDRASGALFVDRVLSVPMRYPCNYGYVPDTLCGDGDPIDVVVVMPIALVPGAVITCRPIGLMAMVDEHGDDTKIVAIPVTRVFADYARYHSVSDLPETTRGRIEHFFTHYKDLEKNKWVRLEGWLGVDAAKAEILASSQRYATEKAGDGPSGTP